MNKKYYAVRCKGGHVGRNKYIPLTLFIEAENGSEAAQIARYMPRVKHDQKDAIQMVTEISRKEFLRGIKQNNRDSYLNCKNIQEQRAAKGIYERIVDEPNHEDMRKQKRKPRREKRSRQSDDRNWKNYRGMRLEDISHVS